MTKEQIIEVLKKNRTTIENKIVMPMVEEDKFSLIADELLALDKEQPQPKIDIAFFRTNILRNLPNPGDMRILRDWLNGYIEPQPERSAEEILESIMPYNVNGMNAFEIVKYDLMRQMLIKGFEEFRSQSLRLPSEEEIPSEIIQKMQHEFEPNPNTSFKQGMYSGYAFGLQDGYKYRNQGKEVTDQLISQECNDRYMGNLAPVYFTEGAQWMRKQLTGR